MKGVVTLNSVLLMMKSMTDANKAKYHLNRMNIRSAVEKVTDPRTGCAYGIRISDDPEKVCRLLGTVNIECVEIRYGNEGRR